MFFYFTLTGEYSVRDHTFHYVKNEKNLFMESRWGPLLHKLNCNWNRFNFNVILLNSIDSNRYFTHIELLIIFLQQHPESKFRRPHMSLLVILKLI